ncbi:MAG: glycosyltransferase [Bacteroidales bacterium]|nr:glycosyltransferase [Bacteroidales bacterium]MCC8152761.1 glycosyltransferase [Tannerellaceae bacterium]
MLFSILIPVYNVEKWMRKCIESVLSQNMKDFEIVLVDDGSTDSSGEICDEYASRHDSIRVIHKKNEGLLLTRRRAIKEAKGKWFIHLDSDDYMMPGFLSSLQNVILETDPTLVIYSFIRGTQDTHDLSNIVNIPFMNGEVFEAEGHHKLLMQFLYGGSITAIWQKAARRDIVDIDTDYHQWPNVNMMEDHLQSLYLLDHSLKTVYMDFPAVYYRYNAASITKQIGYRAHQAAF